jgi:hypothetical protein
MIGGGWRTLVRRSVIVNLDTGQTFEGVLFRTTGPLLVLRHAQLIDERGRDAVPVDGEVVLDRARVTFVQMIAAAPS